MDGRQHVGDHFDYRGGAERADMQCRVADSLKRREMRLVERFNAAGRLVENLHRDHRDGTEITEFRNKS